MASIRHNSIVNCIALTFFIFTSVCSCTKQNTGNYSRVGTKQELINMILNDPGNLALRNQYYTPSADSLLRDVDRYNDAWEIALSKNKDNTSALINAARFYYMRSDSEKAFHVAYKGLLSQCEDMDLLRIAIASKIDMIERLYQSGKSSSNDIGIYCDMLIFALDRVCSLEKNECESYKVNYYRAKYVSNKYPMLLQDVDAEILKYMESAKRDNSKYILHNMYNLRAFINYRNGDVSAALRDMQESAKYVGKRVQGRGPDMSFVKHLSGRYDEYKVKYIQALMRHKELTKYDLGSVVEDIKSGKDVGRGRLFNMFK